MPETPHINQQEHWLTGGQDGNDVPLQPGTALKCWLASQPQWAAALLLALQVEAPGDLEHLPPFKL